MSVQVLAMTRSLVKTFCAQIKERRNGEAFLDGVISHKIYSLLNMAEQVDSMPEYPAPHESSKFLKTVLPGDNNVSGWLTAIFRAEDVLFVAPTLSENLAYLPVCEISGTKSWRNPDCVIYDFISEMKNRKSIKTIEVPESKIGRSLTASIRRKPWTRSRSWC